MAEQVQQRVRVRFGRADHLRVRRDGVGGRDVGGGALGGDEVAGVDVRASAEQLRDGDQGGHRQERASRLP
ncbi:MAG: hypothetical protein ACRDYA_21220 [Egibacteraceae bacterium]